MLAKRANSALALVLILCIFFISGCWSRQEMEAQAYILVLGIDVTTSNKVRLIAQVGLPSAEPMGSGDAPMFRTISSEGVDISDALDNMHLENSKRPDPSHLQVIILSKKLAAAGLWRAIDFLRRDVNIRPNVRIAVTTEDLEEMLTAEEPLSTQPSLAITNHFDINIRRSAVVTMELMDLVAHRLEPDREIVLPVIELNEDRFTLGKTALFKGDSLRKIIDKEYTLGLLLWRNEVGGGIISAPQQGEDNVVSYTILNSKTKVSPRWDGEKLHVQVNLNSVVDVSEIHGQVLVNLEKLANTVITKRMGDVLEMAKEERADFLNIAVHFRRADPSTWKELQDQWPEVMEEAEFDIRGRVHIRGQGLIR